MDVVSLLVPDSSLGFASSGLILLRLFTGLVFIRHGFAQLINVVQHPSPSGEKPGGCCTDPGDKQQKTCQGQGVLHSG